jgi:hypothetical protein
VIPVRYELGFYIPEDGILHSYSRQKLKSYMMNTTFGILAITAEQVASCRPFYSILVSPEQL